LVLPVRGDHRDPGRDLDVHDRARQRRVDVASLYLGVCWFAWAVLWFLFFLLLALDRPVGRLAGAVAILEGIATAWVFGILLLEGQIAF